MGEISNEELEKLHFLIQETKSTTFNVSYHKTGLILRHPSLYPDLLSETTINTDRNSDYMDILTPQIHIFDIEIGFYFPGFERLINEFFSSAIIYYIIYHFTYRMPLYISIYVIRKPGNNFVKKFPFTVNGKTISIPEEEIQISYDLVNIFYKDKEEKKIKTKTIKVKDSDEVLELEYTQKLRNGEKVDIFTFPLYINDTKNRKKDDLKKLLNIVEYQKKYKEENTSFIIKTKEIQDYFNTVSKYESVKPSTENLQQKLQKNDIHITDKEVEKIIDFSESFLKNIL